MKIYIECANISEHCALLGVTESLKALVVVINGHPGAGVYCFTWEGGSEADLTRLRTRPRGVRILQVGTQLGAIIKAVAACESDQYRALQLRAIGEPISMNGFNGRFRGDGTFIIGCQVFDNPTQIELAIKFVRQCIAAPFKNHPEDSAVEKIGAKHFRYEPGTGLFINGEGGFKVTQLKQLLAMRERVLDKANSHGKTKQK